MREVMNLEALLKNHLKPTENVVGTEISRLTAPGENYGSIMLRYLLLIRLLIKVLDSETGKERILDTVGKTAPDSERIQEVFDTQVTFNIEFKFYDLIVPTLDQFLKSNGFLEGADFVAPFYGGRLNLDAIGEHVDENAILLMTNLRSSGFVTGSKWRGLDLDSVKVTLNTLAKFHASSIALRLQKPDVFEQNLKPYFYAYIPDDTIFQTAFRSIYHYLKTSGFTQEEINKVKAAATRNFHKKDISDIWGALIHYDTWTNNVLINYKDSQPIRSILVDFQIFDYGTPLNDVMFFLFTSLSQQLFLPQLDHLINYYYEQIIAILNKLGVNTKPYSKASFDEEVFKAVKYYEYVHSMWMLEPIMDEAFQSVEHLKAENVNTILNWSDEHKKKINTITRLCLDRNWL